MFEYELRNATWWKRRVPRPNEVRPEKILSITDFELVHNRMCQVQIRFTDKNERTLKGRVLYNKLQNSWAIDTGHAIIDIGKFNVYFIFTSFISCIPRLR